MRLFSHKPDGELPSISRAFPGDACNFLLNSLADAVSLIQPDGTALAMNSETARRLGAPPEELIGKSLYTSMIPEAAARLQARIEELMQTARPVFFEERATGRVVDYHLYPIAEADGTIGRIAVVGRDVTAQRSAEEALRASQMLLNRTMRVGKMGGWEWDVASNSIYWSEETYRLHGFSPSDFKPGSAEHINRSLACYDRANAAVVHAAFRNCVEQGESYDIEVPFTSAKGQSLWVRTGAEAIRDADGAVIRVVGYITDISERRASEEALRQSEEKFRTLVDEAAEMLFVHDLDGRICEVNRAAAEGTGYSREELLTLSVWDLDPDADARKDQDRIWLGMPIGSLAVVEARHRRKDGTEYPAEVRIAKVEFGGHAYILGLSTDISARRQAEERARASAQRLNTLLDNLPGMAYRCANDPNWTMEFVSEGSLALTGHAPTAFKGKDAVSYVTLIHPGDRRRVWTEIQEAQQRDRAFTLEYRLHDAQGIEKWVWEKGRCVDESTIEGFITDITERKRYEESLKEKRALENQLHQLQKADSINRLAGAVAHHFNNKLHGVVASLDLVKLQVGSEDRAALESVDIAISAAQQAADISRLMLTCLGQSRLQRRRLDLAALCRDLRASLASTMPATVLLDLELPADAPAVWADEAAIRQIVAHLVSNAWEAEGTRRVGLRVLRASPEDLGTGIRNPVDWNPVEGTFAVIEVTDDGPGISATMVEQIFDPFFSTKFTGRGIGLALVLGLARSHGGGVVVKSTQGEGSVFRVCIPEASSGNAVWDDVAAVMPSGGGNGTKVLLVEDETPLRELAAMMIQSLGYGVLEAANGRIALQQVDDHRESIRCVLSDIRMPNLDGWGLLSELCRRASGLPVIFATAYDDAAVPPEGQREQPDALIRKPYLIRDIRDILERVVGKPAG